MDAREVVARALAPHGWAEAEGGGLLWTRRFDREDAFHKADAILAALTVNQLAVVGRDATDAMRNAGAEAYHEMGDVYSNIWRAMFDAISPSRAEEK